MTTTPSTNRSCVLWLRKFVNEHDNLWHEIVVIMVSYVFILAGAWNDGLIGFAQSSWSRVAELSAAAILALEILSRATLTRRRPPQFYAILCLDVAALLTVFPRLTWIALFRVGRLIWASARLIVLLDRAACKAKNPIYLTALFPFVVPLVAVIVYAIERHTVESPIHNYGEALGVCIAFAFSLGNIRPASPVSMASCGALFLAGIVCIGIITNWISNRYESPAA